MVFDTVIFVLTLYKAFSVRGQEISRLFHILIRDGKFKSYEMMHFLSPSRLLLIVIAH